MTDTANPTTRVTISFDVVRDDVLEVTNTMLRKKLTNEGTALSMLIQEMMYDNFDGPQLEGNYVVVGIMELGAGNA